MIGINEILERVLSESECGIITKRKATEVMVYNSMYVSGLVLTRSNGDGSRAIVELGCVRHLSNEEMQALMHPKQEGGDPCQS